MMSQVWAPSISWQTRTQRVHRMQRLWSSAKSVGRVDLQARIAVGHAHVGHADFCGQVLQFAVAVGDAHRAVMVALREQQLDDRLAVVLEALELV
jgi:hypothetical protein